MGQRDLNDHSYPLFHWKFPLLADLNGKFKITKMTLRK